jgi:ornithine carbamoyltransferase
MRDTGAAAGGMVDFIMARLHSHADLQSLADGSPVPVINALTDLEHPCQALADLLTLQERGQLTPGRKIAYVGDCANNVAHSLLLASAMMGLEVALVGPPSLAPSVAYVKKARALGAKVTVTTDCKIGLSNADAVYTDTWVSMGMEKEKAARLRLLTPYQVNSKLMAYAKREALFMHCLPAHRGEEVTADVLDGPSSVVFQQAANRLHAQKGLLTYLARSSSPKEGK